MHKRIQAGKAQGERSHRGGVCPECSARRNRHLRPHSGAFHVTQAAFNGSIACGLVLSRRGVGRSTVVEY